MYHHTYWLPKNKRRIMTLMYMQIGICLGKETIIKSAMHVYIEFCISTVLLPFKLSHKQFPISCSNV